MSRLKSWKIDLSVGPAFLIACLVSLSPLAGGLIEPLGSSLFFALVLSAFGLWTLALIFSGRMAILSAPETLWVLALTLLSGISAWLTPLSSASWIAWRNLVLGLWIFPIISLVSADNRRDIENAILFSAWALFGIACFQFFIFRSGEIDAFLPNPNILAGTLVLLIPLALERKNHALSLCLALCLLLIGSVGAWLGLALAALFLFREMPRWIKSAALLIMGIGIIAVLRKTAPDFHNRWLWWQVALKIFLARPKLGCGPGVFAYLLPLSEPPHFLRSLYAHQYYLQTAAECGAPYLLIFLSGLFFFFPKSPMKRWAVLASLICGFWDYALAVPSVFWLFCYIAASERSFRNRFLDIPFKLKPLCALIVVFFFWTLAQPAWARWREESLKLQAISLFNHGVPLPQVREKFLSALNWAPDPDVERLISESYVKEINQKAISPQMGIPKAIEHLERATRENPYRPSTWKGLSSLYESIGQKDKAEAALSQERHYTSIP